MRFVDRHDREREADGRARRGPAREGDAASVSLGDRSAQAETETAPVRPGGKQRHEGLLPNLPAHAATPTVHAQPPATGLSKDLEADGLRRAVRLECVVEQVDQHLLNLTGVEHPSFGGSSSLPRTHSWSQGRAQSVHHHTSLVELRRIEPASVKSSVNEEESAKKNEQTSAQSEDASNIGGSGPSATS